MDYEKIYIYEFARNIISHKFNGPLFIRNSKDKKESLFDLDNFVNGKGYLYFMYNDNGRIDAFLDHVSDLTLCMVWRSSQDDPFISDFILLTQTFLDWSFDFSQTCLWQMDNAPNGCKLRLIITRDGYGIILLSKAHLDSNETEIINYAIGDPISKEFTIFKGVLTENGTELYGDDREVSEITKQIYEDDTYGQFHSVIENWSNYRRIYY